MAHTHKMLLPIHADPWDIAKAYDRAPAGAPSPEVQRAYWALECYVRLRYRDAIEDGWRFEPVTGGSGPVLGDAWRYKELSVYDRDHGHPGWSDEVNYQFRAVHDVYGHIPQGDAAPFTYAGEVEAAKQQVRDIQRHSTRCKAYQHEDGAVRAVLTEIIGQAAYFEVHGRFPVQKAALLFSGEVL